VELSGVLEEIGAGVAHVIVGEELGDAAFTEIVTEAVALL
jgi:hypothetical protein